MLSSHLVVALLCGGKSRRFGSNKALHLIDGSRMIERIAWEVESITPNIILVTNTPDDFRFLGLPCLIDSRPHEGPLPALLTVFEKTAYQEAILVACDMPGLDRETLRILSGLKSDGIAYVLRDSVGPQYLFARYPRSLFQPMDAFVRKGGDSFREFFAAHPSLIAFIDSEKNIPNVNTLEDLMEFQCSVT